MKQEGQGTVLRRTLRTTLVVVFAIQILSFGTSILLVVRPLVDTAVTDFAGLLTNDVVRWKAAQTPQERSRTQEVARRHGIEIYSYEGQPEGDSVWLWYTEKLQTVVAEMTGHPAQIYSQEGDDEVLVLSTTIKGERILVQFLRSRIATQPTKALLISILVGVLFSVIGAIVISRQVTRPLNVLHQAVSDFGEDGQATRLSESGPREFAALSKHLNTMSEQLSELLNARALLLAGISHDLRTPIARMRLSLELLGDKVEPELAQGMQNDTELMDRLIGQFLDFARTTEVQELEELDLREIVDGIVSRVASAGTEIDWSPNEEAWLAVDPVALERVLQNLVGNAVLHGKGSAIVVSLEQSAEQIEIKVRDFGPGIANEDLKRIFEPFHQPDGMENKTGSGLGLAIVAQICRNRGWTISLQNADGPGIEAVLVLAKT